MTNSTNVKNILQNRFLGSAQSRSYPKWCVFHELTTNNRLLFWKWSTSIKLYLWIDLIISGVIPPSWEKSIFIIQLGFVIYYYKFVCFWNINSSSWMRHLIRPWTLARRRPKVKNLISQKNSKLARYSFVSFFFDQRLVLNILWRS